MARRDTSPRPMLRPEGFGAAEQTERMLQPEGDPLTPTEVLKTGITKEVMDKAQEYVSNPPPPKQQSPVQKAIDKSLIGGAEEDYEVKVSKVTPEGRGAIRGMISRVLGKKFNGNLDAFYYCTTFVSDMLDNIGADPLNTKGDPYNRTRANAYMKYGTPVDLEDIQEGDIVIFDFPKLPDGTLTLDPTRGKRNGLGDHATFYAGDRLDVNKPGSGYIGVLGGEQGGGAAISMKAFDKSHILGIRRIQYNDIDYEFTKELAKVNPDFNKFLNNEAKAFDFNAFMEQSSNPIQGTNRLTSSFDEGGLTKSKGLSWGELIVDNILGLDNEYESFGERLGKAINEDEIKFLKDAAVGVYEGTKEFVQAPVETTKQVVNEIKDSVTRLGSEDLNTRLQRMYNVTYEQATDEQVNQAREAVLGDALTALELIPAAKVTTTVAGAAIPSGLKADVVGQTKAMLSGDREFLSGTPSNRASTQSLSAGFTGQNPPTYIPKDEPVFDPKGNQARVSNQPFVMFREPIAEFTRKLTMTNSFPSKGITGAEFLKLLEKNAESIPPSSYKEGLVDKNKRYTKEELLDAVIKGPPSRPRGGPESLYYSIAELDKAAYGNFQRQSEVGFKGGIEMPGNSYFAIPIVARTSGANFLAKSQHFSNNTTAHVRGSIIDPMVGYNNNRYLSEEFKEIVGTNPYLLVEEIQSDLLQKGYAKPKNSFDQAWNATTSQFDSQLRDVTYEEVYGPIDNEISKIVKELDKEGLKYPRSEDYQGLDYRTYDLKYDAQANNRFLRAGADRGFVTFDLLAKRIKEDGRLSDWWEYYAGNLSSNNINLVTDEMSGKTYTPSDLRNTSKNIDAFEDFENYLKKNDPELSYDFVLEKYENDLEKYAETVESKIDKYGLSSEIETEDLNFMYRLFKENKATQDKINDTTALPPVRKNKQTVEEGLKILIAKADQKGVDKIVIPPADKIAEARARTIDPNDKGDRFYRTYVTDLNKALKDLEKNYPVTVYRDVDLPYDSEVNPETIERGLRTLGYRDELETFTVSSSSTKVSIPDDVDYGTLREAMDREVAAQNLTDEQEKVFRAFAKHNQVSLDEAPQVFSEWHVLQTDELFKKPWFKKMLPQSDIAYGTIIDISKLREQFQVDKPRQFAKGGAVNKMSMKQQMSLFEYGGIADDGMTKDPVSGNNIPPGSLAKEVRDDIPAMLSEGEYVVPADVLRYYGVNFFENLRGQAKQGLQNMEQNGRIGGTPMTQQDVARNMQQPMMAPAPVQAAQGAMMQSPMRIQQQPAPQAMGNAMPQQQPIMANRGTMVQGFNDGPMPTAAQYRSSWSPARARYSSPMFQGTSSQQANIAAAQEQAATEEITQFRPHYNQAGESVQVKYVGTTQENMKIAEGQDDIISQYPLTEQEYNAYKAEMSRGSGGDGGGSGDTDPTPTGSDTSWMDGIDFGDKASVKEWVESDNGLGMSSAARNLAGMGGILGAIPQAVQAQDIAKVRGIRSYYESINDKEMVDYLDGKLKEAMKETGLVTSAFDKLGLLTGDNYLEQIKSFAPTSLDLQKTFTPEQRREFTDTSGDMVKDEGGASVYKPGGIDVAMIDTSDDGPSLSAEEKKAINKSRARSAATKAAVEEAFESGASTDDIAGLKEAVEQAGGTWATGGRAEGGLMTKGKPPKKKTRKYNKGGLAGKKK